MTEALNLTDQQSSAVQVAPRISKAYIESQISSAFYWNGGDMFGAEYAAPDFVHPVSVRHAPDGLGHHTFCLLRTGNGFTVLGKSAPAMAANFNAGLGRQYAYEDAFRQLWPLYAFALLQEALPGLISADPLNQPPA